ATATAQATRPRPRAAAQRARRQVACPQYAARRGRGHLRTRSSERVDAGELPPDRELVDGLGALVRDHALEVEHVPDRRVLGADAGAAEHVAAVARDV